METDVTELRRERGGVRERDFVFPAASFEYGGDHYWIDGPSPVHVRLGNVGKALRAEVSARVALGCHCDRCLKPFSFVVDLAYAEEFLDPKQAAASGVGAEGFDDGQVRQVVYQGPTVALDEGFWQNLVLALPMKRLCRADCRGVCPHCGKARDQGACTCADSAVDPRLRALEGLLREER